MKLLSRKAIFSIKIILVFFLLFAGIQSTNAQKQLPANFCISPQEKALFDE